MNRPGCEVVSSEHGGVERAVAGEIPGLKRIRLQPRQKCVESNETRNTIVSSNGVNVV